MPDPEQILSEGCLLLDPLLRDHGFAFRRGPVGRSSGGRFARGSYLRGERRLDLSFRHALGLVTYHVGGLSLSHDAYVRAVGGGPGAYPGFSSDPLEGFRHLRDDLLRFGQPFFTGSREAFAALVEQAAARPRGFKALPPGSS